MSRNKFSDEESNYVWAHKDDLTYSQLAERVFFIFGTKRGPETIYSHLYIRRLKEKDAILLARVRQTVLEDKPVRESCLLGTRNFNPEITNRRLVWVMTETDTTLFDVAVITGLDIDCLRGLVAMGGIPKLYAQPVRDFYEDMGVVV